MTETTTYNAPCVHRMPCGLCEIKKEACVYGTAITLTPNGVTITPVPYRIEPNWNEVTCSEERSEGD